MNKKGITLVEIIISIVLVSIVLIFLFSLLITVKDINTSSEVNSTYLINKSLLLKNIEEDLSKAESVNLGQCENGIKDIYSSYDDKDKNGNSLTAEFKANNCIKFVYSFKEKDESGNDVNKDSNAYLGIYYYKNKEKYVISYIHEYKNIRATRELPNFEKTASIVHYDSDGDETLDKYKLKDWEHNGSPIDSSYSSDLTNGNFYVINIPIIGPDGKDYSINISYYK